MGLVWKDKVAEISTTTGTGALTLSGALTGYRTFASVCSTGDTVYYSITAVDGNGNPTGDWETGLGTYSAANTLTRTAVLDSSNAGAAVNFSAGTKRVVLAPIAKIFESRPAVYSVATAGDNFIAVPLDASDGKAYSVVVRGTPSADAVFRWRVSTDNAATVKTGSTDYKSGSTSATDTVLLSGTVGSGREFITSFTLTGMNGGGSTRRFALVGNQYTIISSGASSAGTVAGYPNALSPDDWNGFHVYVSAGNMDDVIVIVNKLY